MQSQLETERKAHKAAAEAKVALEAELESLSQALFEEVCLASVSMFRPLHGLTSACSGEQNGRH